ncbi:MAG: hypothetical protein GY702_01245 [Desulfobulbaceae bacterium]|nr:hypothetical protein [Desulfobulbaceae bacterium]
MSLGTALLLEMCLPNCSSGQAAVGLLITVRQVSRPPLNSVDRQPEMKGA